MKSMLDIKKPLPFDEKLFNKMSAIAKESLEEAKKQQYTQSIVLLTSCGGGILLGYNECVICGKDRRIGFD